MEMDCQSVSTQISKEATVVAFMRGGGGLGCIHHEANEAYTSGHPFLSKGRT